MLPDLQKRTCQALINIFETGRVQGDYGSVTFHPEDRGQLTYGRSQTTLASGNLALLVKAYCDAPEAQHGAALMAYLPRLAARDPVLNTDMALRQLLRDAGDDPVMQDVQDAFFDRVYWHPATKAAAMLGITTPLGTSVVYDGKVHGSWEAMRDRASAAAGPLATCGERVWVSSYVQERREWLANHANRLLRRTVYRMHAFQGLIDAGAWDLALPLTVRDVTITPEALRRNPCLRVSAHSDRERALRLLTPHMKGDDVKALQAALTRHGFPLIEDGDFGAATEAAVTAFQRSRGLVADGVAGPATRAALGV